MIDFMEDVLNNLSERFNDNLDTVVTNGLDSIDIQKNQCCGPTEFLVYFNIDQVNKIILSNHNKLIGMDCVNEAVNEYGRRF